jgi:hypothetical protein
MSTSTSIAFLEKELADSMEMVKERHIGIVPLLNELTIYTSLYASDGELFIAKFTFENYREWPPLIQFIDPWSGALDTRRAYPKSGDSFFHDDGPAICAPFNRGAYNKIHKDWNLGDWTTSRVSESNWSLCATFGGILDTLWLRLHDPSTYKGRKER